MQSAAKEELFCDVVLSWEQAGHELCVLHGLKGYPERYDIAKDVDLISDDPAQLLRILYQGTTASIVRAIEGSHNVPYTLYLHRQRNGKHTFLELDIWTECRSEQHVFFQGEEILKTCRRFEYFKVPAPELECTCYLLRRLMKGLDQTRVQRLSELYAEDPSGCTMRLARFFPKKEAALIAEAAHNGDWAPVFRQLEHLRRVMLERVGREQPQGRLRLWLGAVRTRVKNYVQPEGVLVAVLGTDGAGKSTVTARVERDLAPAFLSTKRYHRPVASALRWTKRYRARANSGGPTQADARSAPSNTPTQPPRKLPASLLKLGLWWADYTVLGYLLDTYPRLTTSTLVLLDRYYEDLLVSPEFYRYGGPLWLARLIGRFIPRPDLTILLDAPPEVIQARKRELPFEETTHQREMYLRVMKGTSNGHVVDASKPFDEVVGEVERIILGYLADRAALRLGLREP